MDLRGLNMETIRLSDFRQALRQPAFSTTGGDRKFWSFLRFARMDSKFYCPPCASCMEWARLSKSALFRAAMEHYPLCGQTPKRSPFYQGSTDSFAESNFICIFIQSTSSVSLNSSLFASTIMDPEIWTTNSMSKRVNLA